MGIFGNYLQFKQDVTDYLDVCRQTFEQIDDKSSLKVLDSYVEQLENLRYNITIIGSLKRGKSTLLNTLMERHDDYISPISSQVCTSAIIKYQDKNLAPDQKEGAKIAFYPDEHHELGQTTTIPLEQLRDYVTEARNPGNRKKVKSVDVYGDFPSWSKAVTIVDSPGQNSVYGHHDVLLSDFLPHTDAIIFLVAADLPLDGGDIALLKELNEREKRKIFFVLTKIDEIDDPDDLDDVKSYVMKTIRNQGLPCDKLYAISAKPVYDALTRGISGGALEALKAKHGLRELEQDLEQFIVRESEQTQILTGRISNLLEHTRKMCDTRGAQIQKLLTCAEQDYQSLHEEKGELESKKKQLRNNATSALNKFSRSWDRVISSFRRQFANKAIPVNDRIAEKLNKGGLISAVFVSFKLKQNIQAAMAAEVQPLIISLEEKISEVIQTLDQEINEEVSLYFRKSNQVDGLSVVGSVGASAALVGTIAKGYAVSSSAFSSALTAFTSMKDASTLLTTTTESMGALTKMWYWLVGKPANIIALNAEVATTTTAAITAGVTAIGSIGMSIAVSYLVQKMLHLGLTKWQEIRTESLTQSIFDEMEQTLLKSLTMYKESVSQEYSQGIEDMIDEQEQRLQEIEELLSDHDPEKLHRLETQQRAVMALQDKTAEMWRRLPQAN